MHSNISKLLALVLALVLGCREVSLTGIVKELFALDRPVMIFCWYVYFYCISMLLMPLLDKLGTRSAGADAALLLLMPTVVFTILRGVLEYEFGLENHVLREWLPCITLGYLCGKYSFFEKYMDPLMEKITKGWCRCAVYLMLCGGCFFGRLICPQFTLGAVIVAGNRMDLVFLTDLVYGPLFFYGAVKLLEAIPFAVIHKPLEALGRQSLLMWFLHGVFFNCCKTITQPILYFPKNPVLVTIWGLGLCYGAALLLDIPLKRLLKWKNSLTKETKAGKA